MNNININASEKFPETNIEIINLNLSNIVGEKNLIRSETTRVANPKTISINAVKNFEVTNWFFVTGRVCVKYASSL